MKKSDAITLSSVVGLPDLIARLRALLAADTTRFILLSGPVGSGKRYLADRLTAAWLCEQPTADGACGVCDACHLVKAGTHVDVVEPQAEREGPFLTKDVRALVHAMAMCPQRGTRRVVRIDADRLNETGQNALLTSLEATPPHIVFLMTVTSEQTLLPTVRSRATTLRLVPRDDDAIRTVLSHHGVTDLAAVERAVSGAMGWPGAALALAADDAMVDRANAVQAIVWALPTRTYAELLTTDLQHLLAWAKEGPWCMSHVMTSVLEALRATGMHLALGTSPRSPSAKAFADAVNRDGRGAERLATMAAETVAVKRALERNTNAETALAHWLLCMRKDSHETRGERASARMW